MVKGTEKVLNNNVTETEEVLTLDLEPSKTSNLSFDTMNNQRKVMDNDGLFLIFYYIVDQWSTLEHFRLFLAHLVFCSH